MIVFALAFTPDAGALPRVLIVEDHRDTRQMYAEFLRLSFEVFEARTGDEALALVLKHVPDVIVTDMSLPGMSGFDLAAAVRRGPGAAARIPIVCLSGYGGDAYEAKAREAGCDRVLQKPCLPDALAETITALLTESRNRSDA